MTWAFHLARGARHSLLQGLIAIGVTAAIAGNALAEDYRVGSLVVAQPWARATPPGAQVAGGYMTIRNDGDEPDRLVSATTEIAGRTEMHEMTVADGVMTMRPLSGGVEVPAGDSIVFEPGSYHLMLMDLARPLKAGERFAGTLTFEKAGNVEVIYAVGPMGSSQAPGHDHHPADEGSGHEHGEPAD